MTNNEVILKYEKLVHKLAISKHRNELYDDLLQEGYIALCKSNKLYKRQHKKKAAKFMTYAVVAINRAMNNYLNNYRIKGLNVESIDEHYDLSSEFKVGKEIESVSEVKYIMTFVNKLPERVRHMIIGLYGLDGNQISRQQMRTEMNISDERLRQLLYKGLHKLRMMLRRKYAKNYHTWLCASKKFRKTNNIRTWKTFRNKFKKNPSLRKRLCKASDRD